MRQGGVFALAAVAAAFLALAGGAAVFADGGTPSDTTFATTPTSTTPRFISPFNDPKNYSLTLHVITKYGPICTKLSSSEESCTYPLLAGSSIKVSTLQGKLLRTVKTNAKGRAEVLLPKGKSVVKFSHIPVKGKTFGVRTLTIKAPVFSVPDARYFTMIFCTDSNC